MSEYYMYKKENFVTQIVAQLFEYREQKNLNSIERIILMYVGIQVIVMNQIFWVLLLTRL